LSASNNFLQKQMPLLVILGPTASGKTRLATRVAYQLGGEILSADSRQVYKGMTIGTGKDLQEFEVNGQAIPYHLIDIIDAGEKYNVSMYQEDFEMAYRDIRARGKVPVICGGSGLYIDSVLRGYAFTEIPKNENLRAQLEEMETAKLTKFFLSIDTVFHAVADISTRKRLIRAIEISTFLKNNPAAEYLFTAERPQYRFICFGLNPPVELRRERISDRLKYRFEHGLVEEVQHLLDGGLAAEQLLYYGLEYKYITQYLIGELGLNQMKTKLETEIHRFAKRQMTFFRKMEKDGTTINWLGDELSLHEQVNYISQQYTSFADSLKLNISNRDLK